MIKRIITVEDEGRVEPRWIAVEDLADVEVTSEEPASPVEGALARDGHGGWRAAGPGRQVIRLRFHQPVRLSRIVLSFEELARPRTQEFVLRWQAAQTDHAVEIVRQQFTFAPPGTTREREDYAVELRQVVTLELSIVPDISGGEARATLQQLCLA